MSSAEEKLAPIIFGDESLSDVVLVVDNQDFLAHKLILACRSDVFKAMFYGDFKESKEDRGEIKDVSVENFRRFLELIYTGKISDTSKFLEFPFVDNQHPYVTIAEDEIEEIRLVEDKHLAPSCEKYFHAFWKDTTELLKIADRFNLTPMVKDYFGYIITPDIACCKKEGGCYQCFNSLIFALINGIDVSKCEVSTLFILEN